MSRHQPLAGADSEYVLNRYRVLMQDDDDDRKWVNIAAALGPRDAENQARLDHPYWTPLKAELHPESVPQQATFPEWIAWSEPR